MTAEHGKRILIVDDDEETRRILKMALEPRGLLIDEAADGHSALDLIRENRYAVVLLDLFMPRTNGFEVLAELHRDESQSLPVVLVVTGADRATIEKLDAGRIHGVVRKPFDPEELATLVVACAEIKGRAAFGTMAIATVISGAQMLQWLVNR